MRQVEVLLDALTVQDLVSQVRMRFVEGTLALQVECHVEDGFNFFLGKIKIADQIATM